MSGRRGAGARMRGPPALIKTRLTRSLFEADDIAALAESANLKLPVGFHSRESLAEDLTGAFINALHNQFEASARTPVAELDERLKIVADAGRALLEALDIDSDPRTVASEDYSAIVCSSAILRRLVLSCSAADRPTVLSYKTVAATMPNYRMEAEKRRIFAARNTIVDAVRDVAFLVTVAEAERGALPRRRPRGPTKSVFGRSLLRGLVRSYLDIFGELPEVRRDSVGHRFGPGLKWLREVIGLAQNRLKSGEVKLGGASADGLVEEIDRVLDLSIETLGARFEAALAHKRP